MMQSMMMSSQQQAGVNPVMRQSFQQMPGQPGQPGAGAGPAMPAPQVNDSLSNLFNDVARKPNLVSPQAPAESNYNPFGSNQPGQPSSSSGAQQNNNQYNPFDL
jgi:hypothetical protein